MQTTVLIISLLGIALVTLAFVYVIRNSSQRQEDYGAIVTTGYRWRRWWMMTLCLTGIAVTIGSLTPFPLTAMTGENPKVIKALGGQWYWQLDDNTAVVGEPVQFHVSTADVTHGFAIYNADNLIIAQTQAMPGYVNKLNVTFDEPGKYRVLCLEYCGLAHHAMVAEINVAEKNADGESAQ